jgi:predicted RND superfamily exporter protein
VAIVSLPLAVVGVTSAIRSNANDVRDWLPAHYPETRKYQWFHDQFGSEDFVVVSWVGCTLDDERLDRLAQRLRERSELHRSKTGSSLFRRVTTGRELVAQLTSEPLELELDRALVRLQGTVLGPDKRQTCAIVTLSDAARNDLHPTLDEIRVAAAEIGMSPGEIHLGGPSVVNAAIDKASTQSLIRQAGLAAVIGLVIAWLCFRTLRLTAIVFATAGYSAVVSLAMVPVFGVPLNAILITMVPLVYVAAMSGAIHLSNYYLESLRSGHAQDAVSRAVRHAMLPLGLATVTTAVGLLSLWYSDLAPIRLFGLFSALGVCLALGVQVVLLPSLLALWPSPVPIAAQGPHSAEADEPLAPLSPRWQRLADLVIGRHAWFAGGCLIVLMFGVIGLSRVETSIQIMRLFSRDTPIIASYNWLENQLGALIPMELIVRFDQSNQQNMLQRSQVVRELQQNIARLPQVGGSLSASTFTPNVQFRGGSPRSVVVNRRLVRARPLLADAGYLVQDDQEELWRISVRVKASEDLDYGAFQEKLRGQVEPVLEQWRSRGTKGISTEYTGAIPIIYKARRSLMDGLVLGFGTDVLLVVVAVMFLLRHWSNGLLLLLTSIFPMSLIFGTMGWLGIVVDIGSVMTPCVALGVTIDDVIHFVLWFRRGIERGMSVPAAVNLAYASCGQAMVQSWGVIGLGLSAFALSSFIPTFRFGALMIGLLTVGLAGNLLFLPALLAGPLGRVIASRVPKERAVADTAEERAAARIQQPAL